MIQKSFSQFNLQRNLAFEKKIEPFSLLVLQGSSMRGSTARAGQGSGRRQARDDSGPFQLLPGEEAYGPCQGRPTAQRQYATQKQTHTANGAPETTTGESKVSLAKIH